MQILICLSLMLLIVSPVIAKTACEVRDIAKAKSEEHILALKAFKMEWMRSANVCQMGEFEIATPSSKGAENQNTIFLFKKGKPVFYRQDGGTYIYSPKLEDAAFGKILVNIWHGSDDEEISRIWYRTVGKDPLVHVDDTNFDGQPDIKTIWKGFEILEIYKWSQNGWLRVKPKKAPPNKPIKPTQ